jgi:hypothetical protein
MNTLRRTGLWLSLITIGVGPSVVASVQLELLADPLPQQVFAGEGLQITIQLRNGGEVALTADLRAVLSQTSSATVVRISDTPWKRLQVLPHQTIVDTAALDFPAVKAETRFLVQWVEGASNVVGRTVVLVYPTNLLAQFKTLAGDEPVGLFDPGDALKPLLRTLAIEFHDLEEEGTDRYHGNIAIFGPFESRSQMRASLKDDIRALARRGVAVLWLLPPSEKRALLRPAFYVVPEGQSVVVVAAHELVAGLAERPESQLNLLRLAEESLHPASLTLPETETSN